MDSSLTQPKLLVVDFTKPETLKPGTVSWCNACNDIKYALENHGCFIALFDNVSSDLHKSIFQEADNLFDLPIETKLQNINEKPYHGYMGQMSNLPLHEALAMDYATTTEAAENFTKLMWPNGNESFCESSVSFSRTVAELERMVVKMLFESYGVGKYTDSHFDSTTYLLRYIKYRAPEKNEATMGLPSHTDKSFLSILYQNQVSGLEIKTSEGEWLSVEFPPSSFVVMAGDACKAWSNNRVLSPSHKVTMEIKERKEARITIGLFSFLTNMVQVPDEFVDDENPLQYNPFVHADLMKFHATDRGRRSQDILKDFCGIPNIIIT